MRRIRPARRLCRTLLCLLALARPERAALADPAPPRDVVRVPFVPQTDALCGGASAAMIFRFWGDRHADVAPFAPLVDARAGGIAADALTAAIEARGWRTERLDGTLDALRARLAAQQPVLVLVDRDRRTPFHFMVVVGADDGAVIAHDPSWGPYRRFDRDRFVAAWRAAAFWALAVTPSTSPADRAQAAGAEPLPQPPAADPVCERAVDEAVAAVSARGLDAADDLLGGLGPVCAGSSRPTSELAGVRLAQHRFGEAADLAERAVRIDPADGYAWDVLGSSRFVRDDVDGALRAWNVVRRPRLDAVVVDGLERSRYALFARALGLTPNALLRADAFGLARRRAAEWPTVVRAQVALVPQDEGWAAATVTVVERRPHPVGWPAWAVTAANALITREVRVDIPGWSGQGDLWSASWRWRAERPRVAFELAAPVLGGLGGVWRVGGSWAAQRYIGGAAGAVGSRETRTRAELTRTDWATQALRYEVGAGMDVWDGGTRTASAAVRVLRTMSRDRVAMSGGARQWWPLGDGRGFRTGEARLTVSTRDTSRGLASLATVGAGAASSAAPRAEWLDAGDLDRESPTLRAHPLAHHGRIDGAAFGRRLVFASVEERRWTPVRAFAAVGVAGFVDTARTWMRIDGSSRTDVDVGAGVRLRWSGATGILRLDYGHGLRDGADVVTAGWSSR